MRIGLHSRIRQRQPEKITFIVNIEHYVSNLKKSENGPLRPTK
jgi:hypothetical protein